MSQKQMQMERQAADWFLRLDEEPDNTHVREAFELWLDGDEARVQAWSRISGAGHELAALPEDVWQRVAPTEATITPLPRRQPARRADRRTLMRRTVGFVTAIAACATVAFVAPEVGLSLQADHRTHSSETQAIRLEDGSLVHLGPDSAIRSEMTGAQRQIRLIRGRAWFEVEPDAQRPFKVRAGEVTTTVLGTGFEVYRQRNGVSVAVEHGRVQVEEGTSRHVLGAGQWVEARANGSTEGQSPVDQIGSWREGLLFVENRPVSDVIEEIRPWYKGAIIVSGKGFETRRVTGFYDMRDPVAALQSLSHQGTGRLRQVTPWLIILNEK
ncbi:MAG: FecR domain-containing protein [Asticcacaulis sp.]